MEANIHKDGQWALITQIDLKMVELKFEGYTYNEISKSTGHSINIVKTAFSKHGRLHDFYRLYATEEGEARREAARDMFKAHLHSAIRTLVAVMNGKVDVARVAAAREIINRQLGEPVKPVVLMDGDRVTEYLEAIKKSENENIQGDVQPREDAHVEARQG